MMDRTAAAIALLATAPAQAAPVSISVNMVARQQPIEGFGAFGPMVVWWDGGPWHDETFLDMVVDDMGATIMRTQLYWDFEEPEGTYNFGPGSDNGKQKEWLQDIAARGIKIIASVWTPPIWMKLDADDSLATFCHGQCGGRLNPTMRDKFAEYLAHYIKTLKSELGIDLYALSLGNEPYFANPFESCVYLAGEYAETLKAVGAQLDADGLRTKVFGPEHMGSYEWNTRAGWAGADAAYIEELLDEDAVAKQHLDIYAVHGYLDGVNPDFSDAEGWTQFHQKVAIEHGRQLWMTETSYEGTGDWPRAFDMARQLYLALRYGRINAWVYWYWPDNIMTGHTPTPQYYTFKQYYRYVRPGYEQIGSTADSSDILVTAFERAGWLTVVMINNGSTAHTASLTVNGAPTPAALKAVRTSASENAVSLADVSPSNIALPAESITTVFTGSPELEPPTFHGWDGGEPDPDGGSTDGAPTDDGGAGDNPGTGPDGGDPDGTGRAEVATLDPLHSRGARCADVPPVVAISGLVVVLFFIRRRR